MSYAKRNSKKKGTEKTQTNATRTNVSDKKGVGTMGITEEFKKTVIVSFMKVMKSKDLKDAIELLAYGDDLAPYVAGICKSSTPECIQDYILQTDYTLSDGEYTSCMTVLNKAIKAVKVSKAARKETKCTKLMDTINSLMQKADDDTIEMSGVIGQVLTQVLEEVPDISNDDATRIALSIVLNAVVCKTIDIYDEDDMIEDLLDEGEATASEKKEEKNEETKQEKKDDASIEGLIDSVTTIFVQNCMDMWLTSYGESRRNEIAAAARQAVGMVVRDTTDLVTLKKNPDKFVQDNTFKVLGLLADIMKKGAQVATTDGLDSDLIRKLLAAVTKDSLGLMKSPIATLLLGLAPSSVTEKVLALSVEDRDLADTKKALEDKGITNEVLKDAIEDPKHELRVSLVDKFKNIGVMGIIKASKETLKDEIIKGINKLVESRTSTHISLSKKEIDDFADNLANSFLEGVEVLNSNTNTHEKNQKTDDSEHFHVMYDDDREKCNEMIAEIFRNARKNAGIID